MIVRDPLCGMPIDFKEAAFKAESLGKVYYFCSEQCMHRFMETPRIAYLSMEVGVKNEIPTFYERRDDWIKMMKDSIGKVA
jgi:YHS domain-containing protein